MATIDDCTISPLSAHTGAEVRGVDLTQPVDAALRERLNRRVRRAFGPGVPRPASVAARNCSMRCSRSARCSRSTTRASRCPSVRRSTTSRTRTSIPTADATFPARATTPTTRTPPNRRRRRCCTRCNCRTAAATRSSSTCIARTRICRRRCGSGIDGSARDPRLPEPPQRAEADGAERGEHGRRCRTRCCIRWCARIPRAAAGRSTSIRSASRGSSGWTESEALGLLDELLAHATQPQYRVPPPVASGRHGDVGQPLPAAQGERRLRHGRRCGICTGSC